MYRTIINWDVRKQVIRSLFSDGNEITDGLLLLTLSYRNSAHELIYTNWIEKKKELRIMYYRKTKLLKIRKESKTENTSGSNSDDKT